MADKSKDSHDPLGFTPRSGRRTSEIAREQGWQTNQDERAKVPDKKQPYDGGSDYGAQDFGDSPVDTTSAKKPKDATHTPETPGKRKSKRKIA